MSLALLNERIALLNPCPGIGLKFTDPDEEKADYHLVPSAPAFDAFTLSNIVIPTVMSIANWQTEGQDHVK